MEMPEEIMLDVGHVKRFVKRLLFEIQWRCEDETCQMYEQFKVISNLPPVEDVSESDHIFCHLYSDSLISTDHIFCHLYSEMRFRRLSPPTFQDRIHSWDNYRHLFKRLLCGVEILLPEYWLWDLVDHFVNQFQSFCEFRAKQTEEDIMKLQQLNEEPWSACATLSLLRFIVQESSIGQILKAHTDVIDLYDVSKALGYFAMVGLLRVHCLLGQYQTGLNRLHPIDICEPGFYTWVLRCQISTVYHCAFANLMLGKSDEALRGLNIFLLYFYRSECYLRTPLGYRQIQDKISQMYALLAVSHLVCSQDNLIDEDVKSQLLKRFGAHIAKAQTYGDQSLFDLLVELLQLAWPKFTTPFAPHITDLSDAYRKKLMCLQECLPFDPDDKEPYISHNQLEQLIETLITTIRMAKLKLK